MGWHDEDSSHRHVMKEHLLATGFEAWCRCAKTQWSSVDFSRCRSPRVKLVPKVQASGGCRLQIRRPGCWADHQRLPGDCKMSECFECGSHRALGPTNPWRERNMKR